MLTNYQTNHTQWSPGCDSKCHETNRILIRKQSVTTCEEYYQRICINLETFEVVTPCSLVGCSRNSGQLCCLRLKTVSYPSKYFPPYTDRYLVNRNLCHICNLHLCPLKFRAVNNLVYTEILWGNRVV
jgi:hypothetical protein